MIRVIFKENGFEVNGHALFANPGDDIVCSAVSVTTIGIINEIERIVGKNNLELFTNEKEGVIEFKVNKINIQVTTLLTYFKNTMNELAKNYSKYINIIN